MGIENIIFVVVLLATIVLFAIQVKRIAANIKLGKPVERSDQAGKRWATMARVALGQSKMTVRPVAGLLHIIVYVGFIIINIEMIEIVLDGILGTHRLFEEPLGSFYTFLINAFEILALLVLVACLVFLARRNVLKIKRFWSKEMTSWPKTDANLILITEVLLMSAFLFMNAADTNTQDFIISAHLKGILPTDVHVLHNIEKGLWWFHIVGIFAFLNYVPMSKHFHILLAFPTTYFSNLNPKGQFTNLASVKAEVDLMVSGDPYATPVEPAVPAEPQRFGAKDVTDLTWKNLMDAYSCTECGRCTSSCPANITGKLLSPRKILMDTRDRLHEVGTGIRKEGKDFSDGKSLLHDYISPEELWACTSCNACTDACPINLDPLAVILDLRRFLVMEESAAPVELNGTFTNIENNGAPWQFAMADRMKWTEGLTVKE